jgi:hypothetical protein
MTYDIVTSTGGWTLNAMAVKSSTSRITATTRLTRDAMGVIALFRKSAPS